MKKKSKSGLITVTPKKRTKGFLSSNISLSDFNHTDIKHLYERLINIKSNITKFNLSEKNLNIMNAIFLSYEKFITNKKINKEDMILKQHENEEVKKITEKNLVRYLIYRYKYNKYPELKKIDDYPPCVQIEPTSICNYRCVMCYQVDKSFSNKSGGFMGHMNLDLFKNIIDELAGNIESVTLASRGEPTLNQNFSKMIEYAGDKFLALKVNTNASMLNEKLIHDILSSNIQTIVFSIDAKDKKLYEKIRVNGKFEKIIKNLELFNSIRNKHYKREDKIVRISGVKINNKQNLAEMKKKWGDIADIIAFTNYTPWESSYENKINDIKDPCNELWTRLFIWHDGKVNPCDYDYKSLLSKWNVKDKSVKEIWGSDEYNYLRSHHLKKLRKKIEPCKRCIST